LRNLGLYLRALGRPGKLSGDGEGLDAARRTLLWRAESGHVGHTWVHGFDYVGLLRLVALLCPGDGGERGAGGTQRQREREREEREGDARYPIG